MVFRCCVGGCRAVENLHSFPSDKILAVKWIMATKAYPLIDRLNENKLSYFKVCKKHFKESDFKSNNNRFLVTNAIPSLFAPDDSVVGYQ